MATPHGPWPLIATCSRGLEEVLAGELMALGLSDVRPGRGVVEFHGDLEAIYAANLFSRTAARVLVPLASAAVKDRKGLYDLAAATPWESWFSPDYTFAVEAAGRASGLEHSGFAALVVKDAVADRFRKRTGRRPSVDRVRPMVRVHVHLGSPVTSILLDTTGEPLGHRGYRRTGGQAPLSESLAAGLLLLAGYDGSQPFLDPMCGSGTIAAEAALIATRTAPGHRRRFSIERLPVHDRRLLATIRRRADDKRRQPPQPIAASDNDARILRWARQNLERAGVLAHVRLQREDFRQLTPPAHGALIVSNPPYGHRLGEVERLGPLYHELGDTLKRRAAGCTAWLLVGSGELAREIGLKTSRRIVLFNGPIECRFLRFDLYEGSKKRPRD